MSNEISNERLELIANNKIVATITDDWSMAKELLALRKRVRSTEEERHALADVAGSNAAHIKRLQRELPTMNNPAAETYGWIAEYPTVPAGIGGMTHSFHDNREDAQQEADAYNGYVVEVIRR
ncbi:hypothetical protein [Pantoea dispersa]|uniref:hypothetical protein n=1 Tax=Pantoea dispersa TaxID=59814 RepID=UPI003015C1B4